MLELIKQVIKSFKHSILLICGLIFISAVIIFSSFSSLYLGTNISNSTEHLNSVGNKSNAIIEQNYADTNIEYNYQVNSDGTLLRTTPTKAYKIDKDKLASIGYKEKQYSVIFPYTSKNTAPYYIKNTDNSLVSQLFDGIQIYSFMFESINNSENNAKNLFPYRDYGMMKAYGVNDETGKSYGNPTTDEKDSNRYTTWIAFAYSFWAPNVSTDLTKIYIDPETKRMDSYYEANETNFLDYIPVASGIFQANSNDIDISTNNQSSLLTQAIPYTGEINASYLSSVGYAELPIGKNVNYDVLDTTSASATYRLLENAITSDNVDNYQQVTVSLNKNKLSNFQRDVFDKYLDEDKQKEYTSFNVVINKSWFNNTAPSESVLKSLVDKKIEDVTSKLKNDLTSLYDVALSDSLKQKNIEHSQQKSFVLTDQKTSHKYIVAQKSNVDIDSVVYIEGTKLSNSTKYLDVNDLLSAEPKTNAKYTKKYLKNLIYFLNNSINVAGSEYPQLLKDSLKSVSDSFTYGWAVNDGYYRYILSYFPNDQLFVNPEAMISSNRQGMAIQYELRRGLTNSFIDSVIVDVYKDAYSAVVSENYVIDNNKKVIPIDEWKKAKQLDPHSFINWINNLDSKYYLEINSRKYVIIGTGLSPEMAFPSTAIDTPIPNSNTEAVVYVTNSGYDSILYSAPLSYEYKYYSLDLGYKNASNSLLAVLSPSNAKLKKEIDNLNKEYKALLNPSSSSRLVYSLDDYANVKNLLTMRVYYPNQILYGVVIVSIILIAILIVLGLYLAYLLIKGYIAKNQVQLAIIKANGFSSISITLSIALFGLVCSIIAGAAGYVTALLLQSLFYQIISPYWFAPVALLNFSPLGFFGAILSLLFAFTVFTFIIIRLTFRKPINDLINQNTEMKSSKLLNMMRISSHKINPLLKFRMSLSVSNVWRTIFFTALCSIGFSSIAVGVAIPDKFSQSSLNTSLNKHYEYRFDLVPTTEQSGLYKLQKYSNLGFTDPSQGLYPLYPTSGNVYYSYQYDNNDKPIYTTDNNSKTAYKFGKTFTSYPYVLEDLKVYSVINGDNNKVSIQQKRDQFGNLEYYGNILVPSYNAYQQIENQFNFYQNSVMTKWLLDFTIPGLNINPWQLIKRIMPAEVVTRAETQDQIFLKAVYESENLNKLSAVEWNGQTVDLRPSSFLTYNQGTGKYNVDSNKIIGSLGKPEEIGYSKKFLAFVGLVYGDEELSNKDVKLSYGIIPYDQTIETYTSVYSTLKNKSNKTLSNNVNLIGINPDSKLITLKDTANKDVNYLLNQTTTDNNGNTIYNLIINEGAAYNYKLKVGDILNVSPNQDYFYYSNKVAQYLNQNKKNYSSTYKLKVASISSSSYGDEFYISQSVANIINKTAFNLDKPELGGRFAANGQNSYSQDNRYQTAFISPGITINNQIIDTENNGLGDGVIDQNGYNDYQIKNDFYTHLTKTYTPFNGVITNNNNPLFLNQTISFSNIIGMWNQFDYSSVDAFIASFKDKLNYGTTIASSYKTNLYYDAIISANPNILIDNGYYESYDASKNPQKDRLAIEIKDPNDSNKTIKVVPNRAALKKLLKDNTTTNVLFANMLIDNFGNKPLDLTTQSIEAYGTVQYLYGNLIQTINLVEIISIAILIPLIIVMVLVISSSMLQEFKRMIIVLKTIGYSDFDNIFSILIIFIPIILLTLGIGTGMLVASLYAFQFIIYTASTVFISSVINWATFGIGFAVIVGVLIINFTAMILMYKQQKLKTAIVD